jgi:hypothetical protein
MLKMLGVSCLLLGATAVGKAQKTFTLGDKTSKNYTATLTVAKCKEGVCEGKGTIKLVSKTTKKPFQTLTSADLYFFLDDTQKPTANVIELYNEQSPLIFDDFNFDGTEDVAVRNGNNGAYGAPSYDVYVYHANKKQFVPSKELTELVVTNLGMFQTDPKSRRLTTFNKSGCCWHIQTQYEVVPKKGLLKVYELEEDATANNGSEEVVKVTTRNLVNGKWVEEVKTHKVKDYYKE